MGDYQNAESIDQRALTLIKHANGPDSPEAAKILNTLGGLYYSQNRYLDAAKTFRQSLSIAQNLFPDNDPRLNTLRKNIKTCEDLLNSDVPASAQASAEKPALSGPIQDLVPDQIKRSMISQLAQQKIFISDLSPRMPVSMDDKGMVFPYHGLKKDKTGNSQEILLLFAAIRNPDKPAALIFQQCRLISYRSYINTMEQGGLAQFKKALMEVFADLYPKSV
jgi:tetratricopeptide (TPR) repeat protein